MLNRNKYGEVSEGSLKVLVETFYGRVRSDPIIGPVFEGAIDDWPSHLEKLQSFWSSVMLTSGRYKGQPLREHVKHAESISSASFERWLTLWGETTDALFTGEVAAALQDKARIGESLSLGIEFYRQREAQRPR
jgi:hemoglobin